MILTCYIKPRQIYVLHNMVCKHIEMMKTVSRIDSYIVFGGIMQKKMVEACEDLLVHSLSKDCCISKGGEGGGCLFVLGLNRCIDNAQIKTYIFLLPEWNVIPNVSHTQTCMRPFKAPFYTLEHACSHTGKGEQDTSTYTHTQWSNITEWKQTWTHTHTAQHRLVEPQLRTDHVQSFSNK